MLRFIDTHNHVGVAAFSVSEEIIASEAREAGVVCAVITTGGVDDFEAAARAARKLRWGYCVGLHPMYLREQYQSDLERLRDFVLTHSDDPYLVGIGEIGLDFFVEGLDRSRQEAVLQAELELAANVNLPVSLHSRRSLFKVMEILSDYPSVEGVLHAFAGSLEQAREAAQRGLYLGVGGAVTYPGSKRVRAVASSMDIRSLVLETDAPDMAPSFAADKESRPAFLGRYLNEIAQLRAQSPEILAEAFFENATAAFPKLRALLGGQKNFVANP